MSEWKEVTLQDVVSILGDGLHGTPQYDDNGDYYFINGNNLSNGKILIKENTRKTSVEEYNKYRKNLNERTILVSINGTLGNVALYNNEKCFLGKSACYFNVVDTVDKMFIKYVVTDKQFQNYINVFAHGTTIKNVSLKTMREFPFLLPPLPEQRAISSVLSRLDDKIDLLRRQNKNLEAMVETLFRQWFVEEVDEGWEKKPLGNILTTIESGSRPKGGIDPDLKHGIPSIGAENINGLGNYNYGSTKYITSEYFEKMKRGVVQDYDVLIYKDGAYVGKKSMFAHGFPFNKYAINEHVFILRTQSISLQLFLYFALEQDEVALLNANSAQPGLNQTSMKSFEILLPDSDSIEMFAQITKPLIDKIFFNGNQIRILEKLRDTLLPKLISGEVRVEYDNN